MAIYDINGNRVMKAYDLNGDMPSLAYDIEGNLVYTKEPITLKAMTYNVGQWWYGSGANVPAEKDEAYYALQNGMIRNANADVLFLQEYRDNFSADRTAVSMLSQYYPYIEARSGGAGSYLGHAICSKYPLLNYTTHGFGDGRYYDSATITYEGISITLVVTHLSTSADSRYSQITTLKSFLSQQNRFICGGDFNTVTIYNNVTTTADDYINVVTPLLERGFNSANWSDFGFIHTYNDNTWNGCLDSIITSSNISIDSAYVDTTKLTDEITDKVDHMPLIAEITIS